MTTPADARSGAPHAARNEAVYETPNDRELVITRAFNAPRALVWAAFTDPRHLPHWHTGPEGFTMPVCEIDLRAGGAWRYGWRHRNGNEFTAEGTYREVVPPSRIVTVTHKNGEENTSTTTFADENGRTVVTVSMHFASETSRDQAIPYAKIGTETNYRRLDAYLESQH